MKHRFLQQVVLVLSATFLLFSCSENENPTVPASNEQQSSFARPQNPPKYKAVFSQLGSATSYVSGTISDLYYTKAKNGCSENLGGLRGGGGGTGSLTFHGVIAERLNYLVYGQGPGDNTARTISGGLMLKHTCPDAVWWFSFSKGSCNYTLRLGWGVGNSGVLTNGSFATTSTVEIDNKNFALTYNCGGNNGGWLWGESSIPNGASCVINTSLQ